MAPRRKKCISVLLLTGLLIAVGCFNQFLLGLEMLKAEDQASTSSPVQPQELVVDILSIGSNTRPDYLTAQRATFGRHRSVRNFFPITEADDFFPDCTDHLTDDAVFNISDFCRGSGPEKFWTDQDHQSDTTVPVYIWNNFAPHSVLKRNKHRAGWTCAQRRPMAGLVRVLRHYKLQATGLPDFLILMDDDTYYNMTAFEWHFQHQPRKLPKTVTVGCRLRAPSSKLQMTAYYGGLGLAFSRQSLAYLQEPIYCYFDDDETSANVEKRNSGNYAGCCEQIRRNWFSERDLFQEGWSLIDLMEAVARMEPYDLFPNWNKGFCFHSDWFVGYFVNYYNLSVVDTSTSQPKLSTAFLQYNRLHTHLGSEINRSPSDGPKKTGQCHYATKGDTCPRNYEMCHYQTPATMKERVQREELANPNDFRTL